MPGYKKYGKLKKLSMPGLKHSATGTPGKRKRLSSGQAVLQEQPTAFVFPSANSLEKSNVASMKNDGKTSCIIMKKEPAKV
jgi:hypothetical protein